MFVDGSTSIEVLLLAVILGGTSFIGLFHLASWALRDRPSALDPWVAVWSGLSGLAVGLRCVQMATTDPRTAELCVRWAYTAVLLLVPVLFRMGVLLARGAEWPRLRRAIFGVFGGLALLAPWTDAFVVGPGTLREGLLGGSYMGFFAGYLVVPMVVLVWLVYGSVLVILARGKSTGGFRRLTILTYTVYVLMGSVEILDGLQLVHAPGVFPYALFLQSVGLSLLGVMRHAETAKALFETGRALQARNSRLDQALVEAQSASKARAAFLANMSHELRTPLNGVLGMAELLRRTPLDETQQHYVEVLSGSGRGLLQLIGNVLDFSKIDAGGLELESRAFALLPTLEGCLRAVALLAEGKGLELALIPDPQMPPRVVGDEARVRQVVMNLLGNAVKFTEGGSVCLRVQWTDGVRIEVHDTGIGIPEDRQAALFQPFVQADDSTTRRYGGTGLGLSITAELVWAMQGRVQVQSAPGQGSVFSVDLPLKGEGSAEGVAVPGLALLGVSELQREELRGRLPGAGWTGPDSAGLVLGPLEAVAALSGPSRRLALVSLSDEQGRAQAEAMGILCVSTPIAQEELLARVQERPVSKPPSDPGVASGRVLIVEDNTVNQLVLQRLLENLGYQVVLAANGEEALARLQGVGCIVMDCQMPVMDGYEATRRLRAQGFDLPVVGLSANAMAGDAERALAAGMDHYLTKPVDMRRISKLLEDLLSEAA